MSLEKTDTIDLISRSDDGTIRLILTDHLPWGDDAHLFQLQEKLNTYVSYVESGQHLELDEADEATRIVVEIIMKHAPDAAAEDFLFRAGETMAASGLALTHKVFPE